jgi:hypothetical protein
MLYWVVKRIERFKRLKEIVFEKDNNPNYIRIPYLKTDVRIKCEPLKRVGFDITDKLNKMYEKYIKGLL